jgi:Family of unknown function (DUF6062)
MRKTQEFQTLLYACTQDGCALCRLTQESTRRFLESWKYELFTDVGVRQELRQSQGFCHTHTWQLAHMGATLQLAQAYRDIISDAIEQLQNGSGIEGAASAGGLLGRFFETKQRRPNCPACRQKRQAELRYIHEAFYSQFAASHGLCLDHFRLACEGKSSDVPGDWLPLLRKAQLACLQRLDEHLGELIRKHDYRFKDEERGIEMQSWKRAAGLVAGEENRA